MDSLDVRILKALQANARLSFCEIARRTGVSVPTVSARVGRLERLRIVRGYRADVDPLRLGETSVYLIVRAKAGKAKILARTIARFPEIRWAVETREGRIVAEAVLPRRRGIDRLLARLAKLREVVAYEHFVASARVKDQPRAHLASGALALVDCFECGKTIEGSPVVRRLDRREHYFCCRSCETLFVDRYHRLKAAV